MIRLNEQTKTSTLIKPNVISYRSKPRLNLAADLDVMQPDTSDHDMARFIMSLRARGIRNTALMSAFERVPRAAFFEPFFEPSLYQDIALPLPCGEQASSPHFIAHILNVAAILPHEQVLEIGTGSGYQTALVSQLSKRIVSLDRYRTLVTLARKSLVSQGLAHIDLRVGDGLAGYDLPHNNFDCIIINGAVDNIPEVLIDKLLPNGRLITCLNDVNGQTVQILQSENGRENITVHGPSRTTAIKHGRAQAL